MFVHVCACVDVRSASNIWSQLNSKYGPHVFLMFMSGGHCSLENDIEPRSLLSSASLQQCFLCGPGVFTCKHTPLCACCGWAEPLHQGNAERENIWSIPATWTQCSSSLRQKGMHRKTAKFPWADFDELLLLDWQQWDIVSMKRKRNAVLQLLSPLLLTMKNVGGVIDLTIPIESSVREGFP